MTGCCSDGEAVRYLPENPEKKPRIRGEEWVETVREGLYADGGIAGGYVVCL